ncbi:DUF547 domain-containing protein [Bizionia arctica]|uniref:DUF547 domain-containing protein n=1 Tax=Bizionia arctica TaxID=1495645 RepID=UPI001E512813|nr:DUF547 domain-containing protein [Bizionia arctica]
MIILFVLATVFQTAKAQTMKYNSLDKLLQKHVNSLGEVNYKTILTDKQLLQSSLDEFTKNQPKDSWSKNETLSYWINAYNAFTIKLIIDNYPVKSIKDIKNPWDQEFIPIGKNPMSLSEIEHEILRKMNEPRIHFAIVCASVSCPKLLNEAYVPSKLDLQLTVATEEFLADKNRNEISQNNIEISKIFSWFSKDFTQNGTLIDFLNDYSEIEISPNAKKSYKDYNWDLNE